MRCFHSFISGRVDLFAFHLILFSCSFVKKSKNWGYIKRSFCSPRHHHHHHSQVRKNVDGKIHRKKGLHTYLFYLYVHVWVKENGLSFFILSDENVFLFYIQILLKKIHARQSSSEMMYNYSEVQYFIDFKFWMGLKLKTRYISETSNGLIFWSYWMGKIFK